MRALLEKALDKLVYEGFKDLLKQSERKDAQHIKNIERQRAALQQAFTTECEENKKLKETIKELKEK